MVALRVLEDIYRVAVEPVVIGGVSSRSTVRRPQFELPDPASATFRTSLVEFEKRISVDVDRWKAEIADQTFRLIDTTKTILALGDDVSSHIASLRGLVESSEKGDAVRGANLAKLSTELHEEYKRIRKISPQDAKFFRSSGVRVLNLVAEEREARTNFRRAIIALIASVDRPLILGPDTDRSRYAALLLKQSVDIAERVIELGKSSEEAVGKPAVDTALQFLGERPDLAAYLYVYATSSGGILFEFVVGQWDFSLEISSTGALELYAITVDGRAALEPRSFFSIGPDLMSEINSRIAAQ